MPLCSNLERLDEIFRKGVCWIELKHSRMAQRVISKQVWSDSQKGANGAQLSSSGVEQREMKKENALLKVKLEKQVTESVISCRVQKRKRLTRSQARGAKYGRPAEQGENSIEDKKNKQTNFAARWSAERYKFAEQSIMEIMKANGASFDKPISRQDLRAAARKQIGDTGLLDHILKHIDGKVTPGGAERFRRCYNTDGVMEYWLESADLAKIKCETGVRDPNWIPPSWWKAGGVIHESAELKLLKGEVVKMKSEIKELLSRQKGSDQADAAEKMYKDFIRWRAQTDKQITGISNSLTATQDMFKELMLWKDKIEQQLLGIANSLNSMQASKECSAFHLAPERWEDWLDGSNLDDLPGDGFEPWFANADLTNVLPEAVVHDPYSGLPKPCNSPFQDLICFEEQPLVNGETQMGDVSRRSNEDQANLTPDSSVTANPKSDIDNPVILSQEMLKELVTWKAKVEQQLVEMSNAVIALQGSC